MLWKQFITVITRQNLYLKINRNQTLNAKTFSDPEQNSETTKKIPFSIKNRIKTKTLHANHSTNKKNILLHEQSLKRATFTRFSNENEIKNEPFAQTKNADSESERERECREREWKIARLEN